MGSEIKRKRSRKDKSSRGNTPTHDSSKSKRGLSKKSRGSAANKSGTGSLFVRLVILGLFCVGLTAFELSTIQVEEDETEHKPLQSHLRKASKSSRSSNDELVEQAITELDSVIIATTFQDDDDLQSPTKSWRCVKKNDEASEEEVNDDESEEDETEDDTDSGDGKLKCKKGEVLEEVNTNDEEVEKVMKKFYDDMENQKEFSPEIDIPLSFAVRQIAEALDQEEASLNHHVRDQLVGPGSSFGGDGDGTGEMEIQEFIPPSERVHDPGFLEFQSQLRSGKTFSHMNKNVPMEKALKQLNYRQSTVGAKKSPLWIGNFGEACPSFPKNEMRVAFCLQYLPFYREQEQFVILQKFEEENPDLANKLKVVDFFPPTYRLYKRNDRMELKSRIADVNLPMEGGPYITKFTFSHGSGKPTLISNLWDHLKKSDHNSKTQEQEAKQKKIIQVYINNPYLYEGKKFIIRNWAVIVQDKPLIVYYREGAIYRSMEDFSTFVKRDSSYRASAHFTNAQGSHKKSRIRSSALYFSLHEFQDWLTSTGKAGPDFVAKRIKPQMKAKMLYAMEALMKIKKVKDPDEEAGIKAPTFELDMHNAKRKAVLPPESTVLQQVSFDFLLDGNHTMWLIGVNTGVNTYLNFGAENFKRPWKTSLQDSLTTKFLELSEEVLWRKINKLPISTHSFATQTRLKVLIDETIPGWDTKRMIHSALAGKLTEEDLVDLDVSGPDSQNSPQDTLDQSDSDEGHSYGDDG